MPEHESIRPLLADMMEKERVVAVIRHHWFVMVVSLLGLAFLFVLPFFIIPVFWTFAAASGTVSDVSGGVVLFFGAFWALIIWNLIFLRWTDHYFDIWVITNRRVVDINQNGLFHRSVATLLTLDHIEDIEGELSGVVGNILNYGTVQIQTAAAHREFVMENVPNPTGIARIIRDAQIEHEKLFIKAYHETDRRV